MNHTNKNSRHGSSHPLMKRLAIDLVLTGAALTVFALFHHVLPREQESLNIAVKNPYAQTAAAQSESKKQSATESAVTGAAVKTDADAGNVAAFSPTDATASPTRSAPTTMGSGTKSRKSGKSGNGGGFNGGSSKGGSAINGESAEETDTTPLADKFSDQYTDSVIVTDTSYSSPDISISVKCETLQGGDITYYIADIYVRDITCFQTSLAGETYGSGYRDSISDMALLSQALLAVNGDYYGNTTEGVVIRNGVIYRANATSCDVCVLYYDGSMRIIPGSSFSVEDAIEDGAWQAWTFGPSLLDADGGTISSFNSSSRIISANPRTAIGYYEPGHYCLVVVDGRGDSAGISLPELSQLFSDLGCKAAYNLDGGNSSIMVWQNDVINNPSGGGRESSDALLIAEVRSHA